MTMLVIMKVIGMAWVLTVIMAVIMIVMVVVVMVTNVEIQRSLPKLVSCCNFPSRLRQF